MCLYELHKGFITAEGHIKIGERKWLDVLKDKDAKYEYIRIVAWHSQSGKHDLVSSWPTKYNKLFTNTFSCKDTLVC